MSEITDKRECMANQLLMRGHATMQEMLTASFGEWPPKGIDINPEALSKEPITLVSSSHDRLNGRANSDDRVIELNRKHLEKGKIIHSTMGHEAVHIMQHDSFKDRRKGFFQKVAAFFIGDDNLTLSMRIMQQLIGKEEKTSGLSADFNKKIMQDAGGKNRDYWEQVRQIRYLRGGHEVQARIHQIVIEGYPRWGKLPSSPIEFYAAMKNAGLQLPPEIEKQLENLPANSSAQHFLKCEKGHCHKVSEINDVTASFPENERKVLWDKVMPALYADLITMYGDKLGGQKMGFGIKIEADVAQAVKTTMTAKQTTPSLS